MFRRKKDDTEDSKPAAADAENAAATPAEPEAEAIPSRPFPRPTPPSPGALARSVAGPIAPTATRTTAVAARAASDPVEGRKLIVGREIVLSGQITSCERLVVEGRVEASLSESRFIEIAESGVFKGMAEIEHAEVAGTFEGTLTVRQKLWIRATGKVTGTVRYGKIEIEEGGQIAGEVQVDASKLIKSDANDGG
ncbi:MAG: polymer-forming cytoskeletal protein [Rhodospirillales bacterium]|nr:polymer-forming cytoskeletal protein [Rhodospirillales bacterium]